MEPSPSPDTTADAVRRDLHQLIETLPEHIVLPLVALLAPPAAPGCLRTRPRRERRRSARAQPFGHHGAGSGLEFLFIGIVIGRHDHG